MSEESNQAAPGNRGTGDNWEEVGRQFKTLGESIAQAVRSAWEDEKNRERVQEMRAGLESMANEVAGAIKDTAESPKGQQVREDIGKVGETVRKVSEDTIQEVRPHLMNALQRLNEEIQKLSGQSTKGTDEPDASSQE